MTDSIHQSLSHLMDNEADELELRRLLKACDEQPELAQTWHRYHLVRSVLHKELEQDQLLDIADRISLALEDEPAPAYKKRLFDRWREKTFAFSDSWLAKGMVAATVAAAVVLLLPVSQQVGIEGAQEAAVSATSSVSEPVREYQQTLPVRGLQQSPLGVQRVSTGHYATDPYPVSDHRNQHQEALIRGYLMQHSEYVAASGTHGMMPMARVSGYQSAGR